MSDSNTSNTLNALEHVEPTQDCVKHDETTMPEQGKSNKLGVNMGKTCTDCISRQAAIDEIARWIGYIDEDMIWRIQTGLKKVPSAQPEKHYCRECKWSRFHANVDKHGKSETYWRCLNWDGETDEEGYCHEWERRTDG